jgi:hypothetical protein
MEYWSNVERNEIPLLRESILKSGIMEKWKSGKIANTTRAYDVDISPFSPIHPIPPINPITPNNLYHIPYTLFPTPFNLYLKP